MYYSVPVGRVVLLGRNSYWKGFRSKVNWFFEWTEAEAEVDPGRVVFYLDADVVWGGCQLDFEGRHYLRYHLNFLREF